jgi:CubicO group peptidase (beta-lactamase class C family)
LLNFYCLIQYFRKNNKYLYLVFPVFLIWAYSCNQPTVQQQKVSIVKAEKPFFSRPENPLHFASSHDSIVLKYWNNLHHIFQFSANILLVKNDSFFVWSRGLADENLQLSDTQPMQVASLSKPFCAVAVMKLVYTNKIKLSDTLRKFFPQLPYYNVTVENLLSHGSGLPEYIFFTDHVWDDKSIPVTNANIIPYLIKNNPETYFQPGARHRYTNTNYVLLACIIEKITGKKYARYLKENIFNPLGMQNTKVLETKTDFLNMPVKGFYGNGKQIEWDFQDGTYGDKNIVSTVWDLYRFYLGLKKNKLFPAEIKQEMFKTRWQKTRAGADYALGWRKREHHGIPWIFHTGWWHGFRANLYFSEEKDCFAVTLSNRLSGGFIYGNLLTSMFDAQNFSTILNQLNLAKNSNFKDAD